MTTSEEKVNLETEPPKAVELQAEWSNYKFKLSSLIEILKTFNHFCIFRFDENGLKVSFLDHGHNCRLDLALPTFIWHKYECSRAFGVRVDLDVLNRSLKIYARKNDDYTFKVMNDRLAIQLNKCCNVILESVVDDFEDKEVFMPTLDTRISFEIPLPSDFKKALKDLDHWEIFLKTIRTPEKTILSISNSFKNPANVKTFLLSQRHTNFPTHDADFPLKYNHATPSDPLEFIVDRGFLDQALKKILSATYYVEYGTGNFLILTAQFDWGIRDGEMQIASLRIIISPRLYEDYDEDINIRIPTPLEQDRKEFEKRADIWEKVAQDTKPAVKNS
jgi:hypothetical protein